MKAVIPELGKIHKTITLDFVQSLLNCHILFAKFIILLFYRISHFWMNFLDCSWNIDRAFSNFSSFKEQYSIKNPISRPAAGFEEVLGLLPSFLVQDSCSSLSGTRLCCFCLHRFFEFICQFYAQTLDCERHSKKDTHRGSEIGPNWNFAEGILWNYMIIAIWQNWKFAEGFLWNCIIVFCLTKLEIYWGNTLILLLHHHHHKKVFSRAIVSLVNNDIVYPSNKNLTCNQ